MKHNEELATTAPEYVDGFPVAEIVKALKSIRYGYVQIVVQDSKVVQIDKTEKIRLTH